MNQIVEEVKAAFFKVAFFILYLFIWAKTECIVVKNYVEVKSEKIYLSDIIAIEEGEVISGLDKIDLGRSPEPGKEKIIDGRYIYIKLKQAKIKMPEEEIPKKIVIKREKYRDMTGVIKKKIEEKLREKYTGKNVEFEFKTNEEGIEAPDGEYTVEFNDEKIDGGEVGKFNTYAEIYIEGNVYKKINIMINAGKKEKAYVLTDSVLNGEKFSFFKVELKDVIITDEEIVTKENVNLFEKKIYKTSMKKGEMIKPKDFAPIRIFKQNSKVKLYIEENGLSISYIVKAMEDGYLGENVKVLNEKSKKVITGVVQENGSVKLSAEN